MRLQLIHITPIALALIAVALAHVPPAEADEAESVAVFQKQASEYAMKDTSTGNALALHPQPLLHWSNPARNGEDGAVFLWKSGQQPVVIGTCFTYQYRESVNRKHAFHILGDNAVECRHRNRVVWTPGKASLQHWPLKTAPPPAATPSARSTQLRSLARRFQVELTHRDGRTEQSRLVPQPLYRYEEQGRSGAIFSFAIGTDPEALLILDQRTDDSGKAAWHYSFARFTFYELEAFLDGESVWKREESESLRSSILARPDYQREPYVTFKPDFLD